MSDENSPYDAWLKIGQDWLKKVSPQGDAFSFDTLTKMFPAMSKETLEAMMGNMGGASAFDAKERLLLVLMGLVSSGGTQDAQIKLTVKNAKAAGATQHEIIETITMGAAFGGVPAMTAAMASAMAALQEDAS